MAILEAISKIENKTVALYLRRTQTWWIDVDSGAWESLTASSILTKGGKRDTEIKDEEEEAISTPLSKSGSIFYTKRFCFGWYDKLELEATKFPLHNLFIQEGEEEEEEDLLEILLEVWGLWWASVSDKDISTIAVLEYSGSLEILFFFVSRSSIENI